MDGEFVKILSFPNLKNEIIESKHKQITMIYAKIHLFYYSKFLGI